MKLRKTLCIILAACLVMTQMPLVALADEIPAAENAEETASPSELQDGLTDDPASDNSDDDDSIVLTCDCADMTVTMTAPYDAFNNEGELSLSVTTVTIDDEDTELEDVPTDNVAKRVTYDITVLDGETPIEPTKEVTVAFALKDVPSGADGINIYHHDEENGLEKIVGETLNNSAETAAVENAKASSDEVEVTEEELAETDDQEIENDVTVKATVDSFSLYTVDFTYNKKTVSIDGDTKKNSLDEIAKQLGITEKITSAEAYQDADCETPASEEGVKAANGDVLFDVYEENKSWYVDAVNSFETEHGLILQTENGAQYKITVTDPVTPNYLTFTSLENGSKIQFNFSSSDSAEISINGAPWKSTNVNDLYTLNKNEFVCYRGTNINTSSEDHFTMTGKIAADGDVTSLKNSTGGDTALSEDYCYEYMFCNCTALTTAPKLPSTTLSNGCYQHMFDGCTSLTTSPKLPAPTLSQYCYASMFANCTGLTTLPILNATILPTSCYNSMFMNCTKLSDLPSLEKVSSFGMLCCQKMLYGCKNIKLYLPGSEKTWSISSNANFGPSWNLDMLSGTGGTFTDKPVPGTVYYTSNVTPTDNPTNPTFIYSSGESWTSTPTVYGSAAAPISNGTWGGNNGVWSYTVNGEPLRNATAWIQYTGADGKTYSGCFYFDKNGKMATGWQKINNEWYFFENAQGVTHGMMYINKKTPDGYAVDASGKWIQ